MLRFDKSSDGRFRADLRITVRVGKDEIVNALCASRRDTVDSVEDVADLPEILSRAALHREVRDAYRTPDHEYWVDVVPADVADDLREWAERVLAEAYPGVR